MKKIHLKIEDEIFKEIESSLIDRALVGGMYGPLDEFSYLLIKSIKEGRKSIEIIKKKNGRRATREPNKKVEGE